MPSAVDLAGPLGQSSAVIGSIADPVVRVATLSAPTARVDRPAVEIRPTSRHDERVEQIDDRTDVIRDDRHDVADRRRRRPLRDRDHAVVVATATGSMACGYAGRRPKPSRYGRPVLRQGLRTRRRRPPGPGQLCSRRSPRQQLPAHRPGSPRGRAAAGRPATYVPGRISLTWPAAARIPVGVEPALTRSTSKPASRRASAAAPSVATSSAAAASLASVPA